MEKCIEKKLFKPFLSSGEISLGHRSLFFWSQDLTAALPLDLTLQRRARDLSGHALRAGLGREGGALSVQHAECVRIVLREDAAVGGCGADVVAGLGRVRGGEADTAGIHALPVKVATDVD